MAKTMIMDGSKCRRIAPMSMILAAVVLLSPSSTNAFIVPSISTTWGSSTSLCSTVEAISGSDVASRYESQMEKMRAKDKSSAAIDDLKVVYEDEHIVVVEKPTGVLSVPGKEGNPSLTQAVFDKFGCESNNMDKMVVHRLGMDTSGLVVFARTKEALLGLNTAFRTRKVLREYEALVCGHLDQDEGEIDMPLMRDYAHPPYMRVSSDDHQRVLVSIQNDLPPEIAKKILENPKNSLTKYRVVNREELSGNPVTRVALTSVSGRTHQLNVHCAAVGHPIVGDKVYGLGGDAAPNGGLEDVSGVPEEMQEALNAASSAMCIHMKKLGFRHPVTKEDLSFESASPF